jgi:hypothetical protein
MPHAISPCAMPHPHNRRPRRRRYPSSRAGNAERHATRTQPPLGVHRPPGAQRNAGLQVRCKRRRRCTFTRTSLCVAGGSLPLPTPRARPPSIHSRNRGLCHPTRRWLAPEPARASAHVPGSHHCTPPTLAQIDSIVSRPPRPCCCARGRERPRPSVHRPAHTCSTASGYARMSASHRRHLPPPRPLSACRRARHDAVPMRTSHTARCLGRPSPQTPMGEITRRGGGRWQRRLGDETGADCVLTPPPATCTRLCA